ncbi:hypothetical protein [Enterocloster clostridioformis]|nr:hypothetical protein [Enterocloster clostridioformis]MDY4765739.1 hypothetical protein [Enterocloster clostridioformis]
MRKKSVNRFREQTVYALFQFAGKPAGPDVCVCPGGRMIFGGWGG